MVFFRIGGCWSILTSSCQEFVLEHARHHASTVDLLIQGEFGWDPEEFHYALQQWAGEMGPNWYKFLGSLDMLHDTKLMFL